MADENMARPVDTDEVNVVIAVAQFRSVRYGRRWGGIAHPRSTPLRLSRHGGLGRAQSPGAVNPPEPSHVPLLRTGKCHRLVGIRFLSCRSDRALRHTVDLETMVESSGWRTIRPERRNAHLPLRCPRPDVSGGHTSCHSRTIDHAVANIDKGLRDVLRAEVLRGENRHQIRLEKGQVAILQGLQKLLGILVLVEGATTLQSCRNDARVESSEKAPLLWRSRR